MKKTTILLVLALGAGGLAPCDVDAASAVDSYLLLDQANQQWKKRLNRGDDVSVLYSDDALFFPGADKHFKGSRLINHYYQDSFGKAGKVKTIEVLLRQTVNAQAIYEAGLISTERGQKYSYMTLWRKSETWKRKFEALSLNTVPNRAVSELEPSKRKWEQLATGQHDPLRLAQEAYCEDAVYYNNSRIIEGTLSLAAEFAPMAHPDFEASFLPSRVAVKVREDLVYEVGAFASKAFSGYMLLIWKKQADGAWRIALDSNE
jgi:ketosteroid isomerase-like protein